MAGVDSIEHATHATPENMRLMKAKGAVWVTTEGGNYAHAQTAKSARARAYFADAVANGRANLALAQKLGVKVASGFDPGSEGTHGKNARELEAISAMGLGPLGAIRAATLAASELMGWRDKVGSLEVGRYGDLIAVRGDPLSDIKVLQDVKFVMKGGEVVRNDLGQ
jgi:imidazolonepropionase-like amidohydrolase